MKKFGKIIWSVLAFLGLTCLALGLALAYLAKNNPIQADILAQRVWMDYREEKSQVLTPYPAIAKSLQARDQLIRPQSQAKPKGQGQIIMEVNQPRHFTGLVPSQPGLCLTFDDKSVEDWTSARSLFKKYGAKATFYVTKAHELSPCQALLLQGLEKDGHEIACHSLTHAYATSMDPGPYMDQEILPSIRILKDYGLTIDSFSYPGGEFTPQSDLAILDRLASVRYTAYTSPSSPVKDVSLAYYPTV